MTDQPDRALSFGSVAEAYDRGRPTYPREAAAWLVGDEPVVVLEVGAGTGKLTEALLALGHEVHATDPDDAMLARLRARLPDVPTSVASAERLPAADASYDVVVAGQAFHWFDHERALPEIARVLRPGGRLALVWNERDERIPWVKRLGAIIGSQEQATDPTETIAASGRFGEVERTTFKHWQVIDRESVQDLVVSRSNVATLDHDARQAKLAEVLAFYDDYGRGMDGMQLPYDASCFRATTADRPEGASGAPTDATDAGSTPTATGGEPAGTDDVLLIDFR
ncbi:class I SAM-dependent methyltransferase [Nocardioides sp. YIM 152315]|uniref:class I SAM-dependent methyltransferase n=1 Tax=Nocardioides sp. YIM 152315 TaxID=3031760 RepID=UPI0023DC6F40|nr:class I SAM-dependent methyltransferase [Nocardioides sp. YIM 152315]MDF1603622.1 class I SAM-dependent methyltransferase [Nocardioides sp. YIM 152315]